MRRQSYDGYTFTYEDVGNAGYEVHNDGEIWAATLWDLRKALGQTLSDSLVIGGLKGTPCSPSMTDARDAILSADGAANGGVNRATIWEVFARHGLGFSANGVEGTGATGTIYDAAFDRPADLQPARGPAITSKPLSVTVGLGDNYAYTVGATNPAGGTLNFSLASGPAGMSVDPLSGVVSWTGTFTSPRVKIVVTDGRGGRVTHGYLAPVLTRLALGNPIIIAGATGTIGVAYVDVPVGLNVLQFSLRNGTGDADLYVIDPAGRLRLSGRNGSNETLTFGNPAAGRWGVLTDAYEGYDNLTLTAISITPSPLSPSTVVSGLGGVIGSETLYRIPLPAETASFKVATSGGSGDVDLYIKQGSPALCQSSDNVSTPCSYTSLSETEGNDEAITLTNPAAGDWYLDLSGFDFFSGVTLTTSLTLRQPDLNVTNSHTGVFRQGQKGVGYSIVVSNAGAVDTTGTVTVVDTLPAGLTGTAIEGAGWTCLTATATCTRTDVLAAGASYPPV
ncbi:MAG TPA: M36 family metallopeptidase, partial [Bryobacteraceae bacterium]|nr:M36 family metallopeptidase [Bryobacteraceae bacterium]